MVVSISKADHKQTLAGGSENSKAKGFHVTSKNEGPRSSVRISASAVSLAPSLCRNTGVHEMHRPISVSHSFEHYHTSNSPTDLDIKHLLSLELVL